MNAQKSSVSWLRQPRCSETSGLKVRIFGRSFVKRFAICYQTEFCLSVVPVCNVGVFWPNGWMDQDETWYGERSRPWPQSVRWGPSYLSPKGAQRPPNFRPMSVVAKRLWWIKIPLGMKVGLGPGPIVLDGDLVPLPKRGTAPPIFGHVYCDQTVAHVSCCWALVISNLYLMPPVTSEEFCNQFSHEILIWRGYQMAR